MNRSISQRIEEKVSETCSDLDIDLDDYTEFRLFVSANFTKALLDRLNEGELLAVVAAGLESHLGGRPLEGVDVMHFVARPTTAKRRMKR